MRKTPTTPLVSNVAHTNHMPSRRHNGWIWAIIIYNILAVIGGALSLLVIHGDILPATEESQAILTRITAYDVARIALNTVLISLGTVYLYRLNRHATWLFILVFLTSLLSVLQNAILLDAYHDLSVWQLLTRVPGYAVSLFIIWYCLRLEKRGILV